MSQREEKKLLAERFEAHRSRLAAIAYRMLGSTVEDEDAVQEAWLRLSNTETQEEIKNLGGWLTTVTSRICLDMLWSHRRSKMTDSLDGELSGKLQIRSQENSPEQELELADSVGLALLMVLETLSPSERLAFVLHDLFGTSFDEIAGITGRSAAAARQSASRARRRVRGTSPLPNANQIRHREIVEAFYAASRGGDFARLLEILDPDVLLRVDTEASPQGVPHETRGASKVAGQALAARREFAEIALVNQKPAIIVAPGGHLQIALIFTVAKNKITEINVVANRERLSNFEIAVLPD